MEFDGRNELYFLAGLPDFHSFLQIFIVGCDFIIRLLVLGFFVKGEYLAFNIFGDDTNFIENLSFDFLSDPVNIQLTFLANKVFHILLKIINSGICRHSHFVFVTVSEYSLFQNIISR